MRRHEVTKVKPYSYREYANNPYNVQNVLLVEHNFPTFYYEGDFISSVYSDRVSTEQWEKATEDIQNKWNLENWRNLGSEKLLKFASNLYQRDITGIRVIRYTNVSNGYPCYRIDVFAKGEATPNDHVFKANYIEDVPEASIYGDYYYDLYN